VSRPLARSGVVALLALATPACTQDPCTPGLEVGQCPPDLVLPDRTEYPVALSEIHRDVVLIELSAVW
jgi:hypothetical protein